MKKIECYLESSALWNLYYEEEGSELVEYCLNNSQFKCKSSIWSQMEIIRGIKKRENQEEISSDEAEKLELFIETDLKNLENKKKITMEEITNEEILLAKRFIRRYNLYASDALHLATTITKNCQVIIVDDYHFKRLDNTIMINEGLLIFSTKKTITDLEEKMNLEKQDG
ncbi:MAG TPA: type II toxin-antitoxin system VapC family toxin [candidate division Zixibacteria bacterium]|nr:type II toxin-antitoxin system VapC family toxin [candidate division Zixibacteria bacterium]